MGIAIVRGTGDLPAGATARGEFACAACGYGVWVAHVLPACPMCRGEEWRVWPAAGRSPEPRLSLR
jgi:hypothetical protein